MSVLSYSSVCGQMRMCVCPVVLTLCFFVCVHGESPRSLAEIVWLSPSLVCLLSNQIWRVMEIHECPGQKVMLRNKLSDTKTRLFMQLLTVERVWVLVPDALSDFLSFVQGQISCFSVLQTPNLPLREVRGDGIVAKRQHLPSNSRYASHCSMSFQSTQCF